MVQKPEDRYRVAIEKEFGVKITDEEVGVKVFQNLAALSSFIGAKMENLAQIVYDPARIEVYFVNGPSTDGTADKIRQAIAGRENWHLLETNRAGIRG